MRVKGAKKGNIEGGGKRWRLRGQRRAFMRDEGKYAG